MDDCPSKPSSVSTPAQDATKLADRVAAHVQMLAHTNMDMSLMVWDAISNDLLEAAKLLRATSQTPDAVREAAAHIVYAHSNNPKLWDHPMSEVARQNAFAAADDILALSTPSASAGPQAEAVKLTEGQSETLGRIANARAAGITLNQFWIDLEKQWPQPQQALDYDGRVEMLRLADDIASGEINEFDQAQSEVLINALRIAGELPPQQADGRGAVIEAGTIPQTDGARQFPLYELAPDFTLIDRDPQADERLKLYRDIFAEITAKATPVYDPTSSDPERVRYYRIPVGPLHRAAGKLGFQLFDGERHLANAVAEIARLSAALQQSPATDGAGSSHTRPDRGTEAS